jgi:DnaJ family protein A protein 2
MGFAHDFFTAQVKFPENNFVEQAKLQQLEQLLPPRTVPPPMHANGVDVVVLEEFSADAFERKHAKGKGRARGGEAYNDDDDDDMQGRPGMGQGVQCASQ